MAKRKAKAGVGKSSSGRKLKETKWIAIACKHCGIEQDVTEGTKSVICWKCVQQRVDPPKGHIPYDPVTRTFQTNNKDAVPKPRGWHLKDEFVDSDGNVFYKGVEQPKLKGTMEPTKVEKPRRSPRQKKKTETNRESILVEIQKLKKETTRTKDEKKINKLQKQIEKLEKKIK